MKEDGRHAHTGLQKIRMMNALHRTLALALVSLMGLAGCAGPKETTAIAGENTATATVSKGDIATATVSGEDIATVIRVIDGDTVDVSLDGNETRVRLLNVDTPETKHPNKTVQCLGPEATAFLEGKLPKGATVKLEYDVERIDKHGRTLAGVFLPSGEFVNEEIARAGLGTAAVFEPNSKFYARVLNAQNSAVNSGIGLFDTEISCSVPAQTSALEDALTVANTAEELETLMQEVAELQGLLDNISSDSEHAFLMGVVKTNKGSKLVSRLSGIIDAAKVKIETSVATSNDQRSTNSENESNLAEEQRKADEAAIAAHVEAERIAAEQAARAEAERIAAEQAEAERQAQQYVPPAPAPNPIPEPKPAQPEEPPAVSVQEPYPGYTGPRCYAPGGKTWTPCPQK